MAQAESVSVCTTMTGLPRSAGFSCCSHDAKKALRSRNSHWTGWSAAKSFIFCSIAWRTGNLQVGKHHAATAAPGPPFEKQRLASERAGDCKFIAKKVYCHVTWSFVFLNAEVKTEL